MCVCVCVGGGGGGGGGKRGARIRTESGGGLGEAYWVLAIVETHG